MKLYIAGPMSGLPSFNYPAFYVAEGHLTASGYGVLNPARNDKQESWEGYMRAAIAQVIQADGVAFLPGSETSRGAQLELTIAKALGIEAKPVHEWVAA